MKLNVWRRSDRDAASGVVDVGAGSPRPPVHAVGAGLRPAPTPPPAGEGGEGDTHHSSTARHRRPPLPAVALLVLALAAAAWWYYTEAAAPPAGGIVASGTIEADEVAVASEVSGRVVQTLAEEGDTVETGELLVKLDDELLQLQRRMVTVAERQLLDLQLQRTEIRSPIDGEIARRSIRAGEIATPGSTLMVVANLDRVDLTLFVPEISIGQVHTGQRVDVQVDSFPGEIFPGEVTFIATEAEFTPRNVQTREDRLNLVFAVKVRIDNPDHRLKPGMPADATILE